MSQYCGSCPLRQQLHKEFVVFEFGIHSQQSPILDERREWSGHAVNVRLVKHLLLPEKVWHFISPPHICATFPTRGHLYRQRVYISYLHLLRDREVLLQLLIVVMAIPTLGGLLSNPCHAEPMRSCQMLCIFRHQSIPIYWCPLKCVLYLIVNMLW